MIKEVIERNLHAMGQRFYRRIFDRLTIGLAVFDNRGTIVQANKKFIQLFGSGPFLSDSPTFLEMLNLSPSKLIKLLAAQRPDKSSERVPLRFQNTHHLYLSYRMARLRPNRIIIEVRDVTREIAEDFHQRKDLQRIVDAGENVFRIVHALKGASKTFRDILDLLGSDPSPNHFSQYLPILVRLSQRISTIVNDLLKIGSKREIEPKEISLPGLLAMIKELPEISSRLKNIELRIAGTCSPIEGAEEELREAIICFIDNAIDTINGTGRADGKICVEIRDEEAAEPGEVVLIIRDNGSGIPADKLAAIFQPFFTTKREGSGLGLAIARKAIEEIHGGKITVTSRVGEGTEFVIHLPHKPPTASFLEKPAGISEKIQQVRQKLAGPELYSAFADDCFNSMTLEHLRESSADELGNQIKGQIDRLMEFLETQHPHVSVNNFSRRTEVVLTADKDSTSRAFWLDLILYELQKLGTGELVNVVATRIIECQGAVSRIFEIRKYKGEKLTEPERQKLEKVLAERFTPLPTLEQLGAQKQFIDSAAKILQGLGKPGSIHSLIFNPSQEKGVLRLVGYKMRFFPAEREIEEAVARRYLLERPKLGGTLAHFVSQLKSQAILSVNETITPAFLDRLGADDFIRKIVTAFNINSVLAFIHRTPKGGIIINLLCSTSPENPSQKTESELLALNQRWLDL